MINLEAKKNYVRAKNKGRAHLFGAGPTPISGNIPLSMMGVSAFGFNRMQVWDSDWDKSKYPIPQLLNINSFQSDRLSLFWPIIEDIHTGYLPPIGNFFASTSGVFTSNIKIYDPSPYSIPAHLIIDSGFNTARTQTVVDSQFDKVLYMSGGYIAASSFVDYTGATINPPAQGMPLRPLNYVTQSMWIKLDQNTFSGVMPNVARPIFGFNVNELGYGLCSYNNQIAFQVVSYENASNPLVDLVSFPFPFDNKFHHIIGVHEITPATISGVLLEHIGSGNYINGECYCYSGANSGGGGVGGIGIGMSGGTFYWINYTGCLCSGQPTFSGSSSGTTSGITLTIPTGILKLYLDGDLVATGFSSRNLYYIHPTGEMHNPDFRLWPAPSSNPQYYVNDLRVYSKTITNEQAQQMYSNPGGIYRTRERIFPLFNANGAGQLAPLFINGFQTTNESLFLHIQNGTGLYNTPGVPLHTFGSSGVNPTSGFPLHLQGNTNDLHTTLFLKSDPFESLNLHIQNNDNPTESLNLYLHNPDFPANSNFPLHIYGAQGTNVTSGVPLFLSSLPYASSTLWIQGVNTTSESMNLHIKGMDVVGGTGIIPLFIMSSGSNKSTTLHIAGANFANESLDLFLQGNPYAPLNDGSTTLHTEGTTNKGLHQFTSLHLETFPDFANILPLHLQAASTYLANESLDLHIFGTNVIGSPNLSTNLFLQNNVSALNNNSTLFITAPGENEFFVPQSESVNLFIKCQLSLGVPLHLQQNQMNNNNNITIFMNAVPTLTGSITLSMPDVLDVPSGTCILYSHGF